MNAKKIGLGLILTVSFLVMAFGLSARFLWKPADRFESDIGHIQQERPNLHARALAFCAIYRGVEGVLIYQSFLVILGVGFIEMSRKSAEQKKNAERKTSDLDN